MGTEVRPPIARRALRRFRRDGPASAMTHARDFALQRVYLREQHVWYQLDVFAERPRPELPPRVRLVRGGPDDADRVEELDQSPETARERLGADTALWLAVDGDELLFGCWIFPERAPVLAAPVG